jgi:hypothetical protein
LNANVGLRNSKIVVTSVSALLLAFAIIGNQITIAEWKSYNENSQCKLYHMNDTHASGCEGGTDRLCQFPPTNSNTDRTNNSTESSFIPGPGEKYCEDMNGNRFGNITHLDSRSLPIENQDINIDQELRLGSENENPDWASPNCKAASGEDCWKLDD